MHLTFPRTINQPNWFQFFSVLNQYTQKIRIIIRQQYWFLLVHQGPEKLVIDPNERLIGLLLTYSRMGRRFLITLPLLIILLISFINSSSASHDGLENGEFSESQF